LMIFFILQKQIIIQHPLSIKLPIFSTKPGQK
jgi:hypothetical protein